LSNIAKSIKAAALRVLETASPVEKCAAASAAAAMATEQGPVFSPGDRAPPAMPARPDRPYLNPPADAPRRGPGTAKGRIALLHAIAHIEFNAIDLAFDMIARFSSEISVLGLDERAFANDWLKVGADEARHFLLVRQRLNALGADYGDLAAHGGLWDAAAKTQSNLLARLVVAPLILEARGLDVTPGMINRLTAAGDRDSASMLQIIYDEEINHVATGGRWFHAICKAKNAEPEASFHRLQREFFPAGPKPPFNHTARDLAGLPRSYYEPI